MVKYFAASNSAYGFKNYYEDCFSLADKLYIIKGGPGTGKSGFIERCAKLSEEKGHFVERFCCSSDPDSLDGVIIYARKTIAVIDGTAPHTYEMIYPGVRDNIINLGDAWDDRVLDKYRDEILSLGEAKALEYKRAYDALSICGNLSAVGDSYADSLLQKDRAVGAMRRLVERLDLSGNGVCRIRLIDSVGMKGRVRLDTFEKMAEKCIIVGDTYGMAHVMLDIIKEELDAKRCDYYISYDPIIPKRINGIFERGKKIAFVVSDPRVAVSLEDDKIGYINIKRFTKAVLPEMKAELKYTFSLYKRSVEMAQRHLGRASAQHFALEEIYRSAMSFDIVNQKIESFCKSVL